MNINRIIALCALVLLPAAGMAQNEKRGFANIDWQFNIPLSNGFSDKASGWGMNIEGGYYFENNIGIGLFFALSTAFRCKYPLPLHARQIICPLRSHESRSRIQPRHFLL